jgi:hypothetical protein
MFNNSRLEGNIKKAAQKRDMNSVPEQKCSQPGNSYPGKYMIFIEARSTCMLDPQRDPRSTHLQKGTKERERESRATVF